MLLSISLAEITSNLPVLLSVLLGVYEVVARAIPTVKDITVIGNIVKLLQTISDFLNVKKSV